MRRCTAPDRLGAYTDGLVFEVRDTGTGFDRSIDPPGAGLTNMHDRLAALGR